VSFLESFRSRAVSLALGLVCAVPADLAVRSTILRAANPSGVQEPNVVKGTVRTVSGRPIAGATIRIAGATGAARGNSITATTDRNGNYRVRVPLGHYNVDAWADIAYDGQTYRELWLHRVNGGCERVMSDKGIVRDFVLQLSGPKRCINNPDPNNPNSYYGAYITAMTSAFPGDAVITFTLTPLGALADGSTGKTIRFTRTGAALVRGGGTIGETAFLHDLPLGRYRVAAEVRYANGTRRALAIDSRDDDEPEGSAIEIDFPAAVMGGGFRSVNLGLGVGGRAPRPDPVEPATPGTSSGKPTTPATADVTESALPSGRYACSYRSQYAGDIPTASAVTISPDGRYEAYGGAGTYAVDERSGGVRWTSGPLARSDTRATFAQRNGRPTITVVGGGAAADGGTHTCVLSGS
jgi:hypothetical protein